MNYIVAKFAFWILKENHHEKKHTTGFSVLTTIEFYLMAEFTKSCKQRSLYNDLRNLAPIGADDLTVQDLYHIIISLHRLARTADLYQCTVQFCTIQSYYGPEPVPHCHQPVQADFCKSQILARSLYCSS
jgi:hypothetical protein